MFLLANSRYVCCFDKTQLLWELDVIGLDEIERERGREEGLGRGNSCADRGRAVVLLKRQQLLTIYVCK